MSLSRWSQNCCDLHCLRRSWHVCACLANCWVAPQRAWLHKTHGKLWVERHFMDWDTALKRLLYGASRNSCPFVSSLPQTQKIYLCPRKREAFLQKAERFSCWKPGMRAQAVLLWVACQTMIQREESSRALANVRFWCRTISSCAVRYVGNWTKWSSPSGVLLNEVLYSVFKTLFCILLTVVTWGKVRTGKEVFLK